MANHPNRSKRAITLYCDYHTPTVFYALHEGAWYIVPSTPTGWADRRLFAPTAAVVDRMTSANEVTTITRAWQAEAALGIPRDVWSTR